MQATLLLHPVHLVYAGHIIITTSTLSVCKAISLLQPVHLVYAGYIIITTSKSVARTTLHSHLVCDRFNKYIHI